MHRKGFFWAAGVAAALALAGCSRGEEEKPGSASTSLYGDNAGETELGKTTSNRPDPEGTGGSGGQREEETRRQNERDLNGEEQTPRSQETQPRGSGAADPGNF